MTRFAYLTALAASFVLAAGTTAASGAARPDDRATHGPGAVVEPRSEIIRPDDRAVHGQGAIVFEQVTRSGQAPVIAPSGSGSGRVDGFDWLDAGIGAAAALGLGLIAVGGVVVVLRRTQSPAYW